MALLPTGEGSTWSILSVNTVLGNAYNILLGLVGVVATIFIIIGAYQYLTAFGSDERAEAGKKTLTWAIIGLVVIILSGVVLNSAWKLFSGNDMPAQTITAPTPTITPTP
jgi:FtsH-binding integral membrane protein